MISIFKPTPKTSSKFSEFIRKSSSKEKKRVYTAVLQAAADRQRALLQAYAAATKTDKLAV
jgi:hypothetical protein